MKDGLGRKVLQELVGLRSKTFSYLTDDNDESEKAKGYLKCVIERKLKFEDYKTCSEVSQPVNKIIHARKSKIDVKAL